MSQKAEVAVDTLSRQFDSMITSEWAEPTEAESAEDCSIKFTRYKMAYCKTADNFVAFTFTPKN